MGDAPGRDATSTPVVRYRPDGVITERDGKVLVESGVELGGNDVSGRRGTGVEGFRVGAVDTVDA